MFGIRMKTIKTILIVVFSVLFVLLVVGIVVANFDFGSGVKTSSDVVPADMKCSVKELSSYKVNTTYYYTKDDKSNNLGAGWCEPEVEGTWTTGQESNFYFKLDEVNESQRTYFVSIAIKDTMAYNNRLYVNGVDCGQIKLPVNMSSKTEPTTVCIIIPIGTMKEGINTFTIKADTTIKMAPHRFPKYDFEDDYYNLLVYDIFLGSMEKTIR